MAMIRLPTDFKDFLRLLNDHLVEYLLIGGYAVAWHGYPRATADLDVFVGIHAENARRLANALKAFGFDPQDLPGDLFQAKDRIIRIGLPPIRVEIMTGISGLSFEECYAARVRDELDGVPVNIICLEHLRENKKASGRHKDLDDIEHLP